MIKKILLGSSLLLFSGCMDNNAYRYFKKDGIYSENLRFTQHAQVLKDNKIEKIFYVSYLSAYLEEYKNKENFLVAIYDVKDREIDIKDYFFNLNGDNNFKIEKVDDTKKADFINQIELNNNWAQYYIVSFDKQQFKYRFNLIISDKLVEIKEEKIVRDIFDLKINDDDIIPEQAKVENLSTYDLQKNSKFIEGENIILTFEK